MRTISPTVIARETVPGDVPAAEMTASAFQVVRVSPMLGRALIEQDEREGADPVVVIGYDLWRSGFSSAADAVGQRLQVDGTPHTVVGIMPEGFRFPIKSRSVCSRRRSRAPCPRSAPRDSGGGRGWDRRAGRPALVSG
jgi:hypothetical protein